MALPAIAPYELPGPADLPPRKVPWQVDPARAAVLVHDLQNYFLGAFPAEGPRWPPPWPTPRGSWSGPGRRACR